jgi:hypothetical protein
MRKRILTKTTSDPAACRDLAGGPGDVAAQEGSSKRMWPDEPLIALRLVICGARFFRV